MKIESVSKKKEAIQGIKALTGSAFAFSLMTVCVKHLDGRIPVIEIVFLRALISLVITRVMMMKAGINPWGQNKKLLLIRGLMGTAALLCVFKALSSLSLAAATIIQYTYPTFTTILAWLLLSEAVKKRILLAVLLGLIGVTLVANPFDKIYSISQGSSSPIVIALLGSILTAIAYICVRKLSKEENALVIVHYFPLVSVPITLPFMFVQGVMPSSMEWVWILGIGLFTQIGQVLITQGLSLLPAGIASSINYTQVIFASIWGIIIFSEPLDLYIFVGAILVLASTLISLSSAIHLKLEKTTSIKI